MRHETGIWNTRLSPLSATQTKEREQTKEPKAGVGWLCLTEVTLTARNRFWRWELLYNACGAKTLARTHVGRTHEDTTVGLIVLCCRTRILAHNGDRAVWAIHENTLLAIFRLDTLLTWRTGDVAAVIITTKAIHTAFTVLAFHTCAWVGNTGAVVTVFTLGTVYIGTWIRFAFSVRLANGAFTATINTGLV